VPRRIAHVLLRNTVSNYTGTFVSLSVGLALVPLIIHQLGSATYGLWVLVTALVGFSSLLDLGLRFSLVRWVAEYRGRNDQTEMNAFLSTVFLIYLALGVLTLLLVCAVAVFVDKIFTIPPADVASARILLLIAGVGAAANFPLSVFGGVLTAYERIDLANALTITNLLLSFGLIAGLLANGYGVVSLAAVQTVVGLLVHAIRFVAARRVNPSISLSLRAFEPRHLRMIGSYTLYIFVERVAGHVVLKTDEIIIGLFLPLSAVSTYAIGLRLNNAVRMLSEQLPSVVFPTGAGLHTAGDTAKLRRLLVEGTRMTLALGLPLAVCGAMLADPVISVWVGPEFVGAASITRVLLIATIAFMVQWVPVVVAQAVGKVVLPSLVGMLEMVANLVLSIVLVKEFGILGVALGTAIPGVVSSVMIRVPWACRVLQVGIGEFVRKALLPPALAAVPMIVGLHLLAVSLEGATLLGLVLRAGLAVLLYWLVFLAFCIPRREVRDYADGVLRLLTRA